MKEGKLLLNELAKLEKDVENFVESLKRHAQPDVREYLAAYELFDLISECKKNKDSLPLSIEEVQSIREVSLPVGSEQALNDMEAAMKGNLSKDNAATVSKKDQVAANPAPLTSEQSVPVAPTRGQSQEVMSADQKVRSRLKEQSQHLLAEVTADIERRVSRFTHEKWNLEFHNGGKEAVQDFAFLTELHDQCIKMLPKLNDQESLSKLNAGLQKVRHDLGANYKAFNTSRALNNMRKTVAEMEKTIQTVEKDAATIIKPDQAAIPSSGRSSSPVDPASARSSAPSDEERLRRIEVMRARTESPTELPRGKPSATGQEISNKELGKMAAAVFARADKPSIQRDIPVQFRGHVRTKMDEIDQRINAMKARAESNTKLLKIIDRAHEWAQQNIDKAGPNLIERILIRTEKQCDAALKTTPTITKK
jgi:hypothetical protein